MINEQNEKAKQAYSKNPYGTGAHMYQRLQLSRHGSSVNEQGQPMNA